MTFDEYASIVKNLPADEKDRYVVNTLLDANRSPNDDDLLMRLRKEIPIFVGRVLFFNDYYRVCQISHVLDENILKYPYDLNGSPKIFLGYKPQGIDVNEKVLFIISCGRLEKPNELLNMNLGSLKSFKSLQISDEATSAIILERILRKQPFSTFPINDSIQYYKDQIKHGFEAFVAEIDEKKNELDKEYQHLKEQVEHGYEAYIAAVEEKKKELDKEYQQQVEKKEIKCKKIDERIQSLLSTGDEIRQQIRKLEAQQSVLQKQITETQKLRDAFVNAGLIYNEHKALECNDTQVFEPETYKDLVGMVIKKVVGSGLDKYSSYERVIERFLNTVFTNQILILSGKPGSGKTSLPIAVANAIGAECRVVSVQPNWTDNQDLLGFFSPIDHSYHSTAFLDALREAAFFPEKMFFICLDEMNLSHVEYYFSEILSGMEKKSREIRIHNQHYQDSRLIIEKLKQLTTDTYGEMDSESLWNYINSEKNGLNDEISNLSNALLYPATITIPNNVVFIGTLNMDGTTTDLSPKVLDRAYVLQIERDTNAEHYYSAENDYNYAMNVSYSNFIKLRSGSSFDSETVEKLTEKIQNFENVLSELHKKNSEFYPECMSGRFWVRFMEFIQSNSSWINDDNITQSVCDIVAGRMLPIISCPSRISHDECEHLRNAVRECCGEDSYIVNSKWYNSIKEGNSVEFGWRR